MASREHLLEQIQEICDRKQTGVLVLGRGEHRAFVYFQGGLIAAANSNAPNCRLGQIFAEAGLVDDEGIDQLLKEAGREQLSIGQTAVQSRLLDLQELQDLVQAQVVRVLKHALLNEFEVQSFGETSRKFFAPARINLDYLMLHLARENPKPFSLRPDQYIVLKEGQTLSHLPWFPQELAVLNGLKVPRTLQELADSTGLDEKHLRKVFSVFNTLNLLLVADKSSAESRAVVRRNGFPYQSIVPVLPTSGIDDKVEPIKDGGSFISEQFKTLKVRIGELSATRPVKVLVVSSPGPEEGKSLMSLNLAASFSQDPGRRTLLVDCDFRNPSIHRLVGASIAPGLLGCLNEESLQPFCYMRRVDRLYLLTSGGLASNPIELLSLHAMQKQLDLLRADFDTIILDAPPLAPISDAHVLAGFADGLILVVRSGWTSYGAIEKAFHNLDRGKLIGVVLNDVQPRRFNTQYDYRYYRYRYRHRYPYGRDIPHRNGVRLKSYLER